MHAALTADFPAAHHRHAASASRRQSHFSIKGFVMSANAGHGALIQLLEKNEAMIGFFYRLATALLVGALIVHLAFAAYYVLAADVVDGSHVLLFAVFNVAALVAEVFLSRIAFMLGARAGQLRDTRYALEIACSDIDPVRFESAARAIMSMRRDVGALKIMDIENVVERLGKLRGGAA
jgi:hypothetical protein